MNGEAPIYREDMAPDTAQAVLLLDSSIDRIRQRGFRGLAAAVRGHVLTMLDEKYGTSALEEMNVELTEMLKNLSPQMPNGPEAEESDD